MDLETFEHPSGELVLINRDPPARDYLCFVPAPLPPNDEANAVRDVASTLADAAHALGQLDGIGQILPNPDLLVRPYIRREAVLSSRIEGTQTSYSELVVGEATGGLLSKGELREVLNYVTALHTGLRRIETQGITEDLVRDLHRTIMSDSRGESFATPGEFRSVQNHIDGRTTDPAEARFVPPHPEFLHRALSDFFAYVAADTRDTPLLVKAAWMHYQFETIHPFIDGNGRVGRLLIPLLLASQRRLAHPLLYLSPYFERQRSRYYELLFAVSAESRWLEWLRFFLEGVRHQADEAIGLAKSIIALGDEWRAELDARSANRTTHRLAEFVLQHTAVDAKMVELNLAVASQTAYTAINTLVQADILQEITGRARDRIYVAPALLKILEPLPRN